jgi:hypothetical protein
MTNSPAWPPLAEKETSQSVRLPNFFRSIAFPISRNQNRAEAALLTYLTIVERAAFFQNAIQESKGPLELPAIQALIETFVHQNDEEYAQLRKERRAGRPASTREDILRMKIAVDEKEHEIGFCTCTPLLPSREGERYILCLLFTNIS